MNRENLTPILYEFLEVKSIRVRLYRVELELTQGLAYLIDVLKKTNRTHLYCYNCRMIQISLSIFV